MQNHGEINQSPEWDYICLETGGNTCMDWNGASASSPSCADGIAPDDGISISAADC